MLWVAAVQRVRFLRILYLCVGSYFLSRLDPTVGENSVVFTVIILRAGGFLDSSKGKFSCFLGGFIHPDTELRSVVSFSGVSLGCFPSVYELFLF